MQAEFNEKLGEFYKTVSKPLTEQAELNINTVSKCMNKWSKNSNVLEKLSRAKRPEELFNAQLEFANAAAIATIENGIEGIKYWEESCKIWGDALSHSSHAYASTIRETTKRSDSDKPSKF